MYYFKLPTFLPPSCIMILLLSTSKWPKNLNIFKRYSPKVIFWISLILLSYWYYLLKSLKKARIIQKRRKLPIPPEYVSCKSLWRSMHFKTIINGLISGYYSKPFFTSESYFTPSSLLNDISKLIYVSFSTNLIIGTFAFVTKLIFSNMFSH